MSAAQVVALPAERLEEAVACQVAAFADDPIFGYFFPGETEQRLEKMRVVFESGCQYRFLTEQPLLALVQEGEVVGVANVRTPGTIEESADVKRLWGNVAKALGPESDERFETYRKIKARFTPDKPHHYLVSLSIRPGHQGNGLGGQLLEAVCQLAEDHPTSEAIVLDTGTDINLKFYAKHKFHRIGEGTLGNAPCYWLMRNCDE